MKSIILSFLLFMPLIFGTQTTLATTVVDQILGDDITPQVTQLSLNDIDLKHQGSRLYACSTHPTYCEPVSHSLCRKLGFSKAVGHSVEPATETSDELLWVVLERRAGLQLIKARLFHLPKRRYIFSSLSCAK